MLCKKRTPFLIISIVIILLAPAIGTSAQAQNKGKPIEGPGKGDTAISGYSERGDSNFVMALQSRYWYPDLTLFIYSGNRNASYQINLNQIEYANGSFQKSDWIQFDISLPQGEQVHLKIEVGGYTYEWKKLVAAGSVEGGWGEGDKKGGEGELVEDFTMKQLRIFSITLVFGLIPIPPTVYLARKSLKKKPRKMVGGG